ncbi:hypothetical protein Tco_0822426 [Tanacetum coccineum]|uniref:Uncharacterized protein n=1 Tax=Tanacetum coccineum TaxID=301880 RepID=A0ABQ5AI58_9ASTR
MIAARYPITHGLAVVQVINTQVRVVIVVAMEKVSGNGERPWGSGDDGGVDKARRCGVCGRRHHHLLSALSPSQMATSASAGARCSSSSVISYQPPHSTQSSSSILLLLHPHLSVISSIAE